MSLTENEPEQLDYQICDQLNFKNAREIDACIVVSSSKPGNGVEHLLDNNFDTFWQSDGIFPHSINIQFFKKESISKICFYFNFASDESYTPKRLIIKSGTLLHDLIDIKSIELHEPANWTVIDLQDIENIFEAPSPKEDVDDTSLGSNPPLRTHFLQINILSMHQNGRDTRIRQLKILGPSLPTSPIQTALNLPSFMSSSYSNSMTNMIR